MTWQEPIVALIVGLAVVSFYRHVRSMIGSTTSGDQQSCHGCDDCGDEVAPVIPTTESVNPEVPMSLRLPTALLVVSLAAGFSIELQATESEQQSSNLPACDPNDGGLVLPEGFCAVIVADNLGSPRLIDVSANGDIYVHDQGTRGDGENVPGNGVVALRDLDGDGRADVIERFSDHYGTGLQLRGDHLYLSTTTEVYRYAMTPGELVPPGEAELVVGGFPEQRGHADKAFAFDDAGNMYVNVGAPSNACMKFARTRGSAGLDPCPQRVRQASVWRFDAEQLGQTQGDDGHQLVTGTRNIVGIGWDPSTRGIYAVQHGRDALGSLWGYDDERNAEIPSEELLPVN